jgi:hypothetical protein
MFIVTGTIALKRYLLQHLLFWILQLYSLAGALQQNQLPPNAVSIVLLPLVKQHPQHDETLQHLSKLLYLHDVVQLPTRQQKPLLELRLVELVVAGTFNFAFKIFMYISC